MMQFLTAKKRGVFRYEGHAYDLEPITYPQVDLNQILAINHPLGIRICSENPVTMQGITFEVEKLPGYPKPLSVPPQELPEGSRLMLLRAGGIGDVIMLTPALKYLRKTVDRKISIHLSTFGNRIPLLDGLGCVDAFFPHPIRLYDFMKSADYYLDFSDPGQRFEHTDMIDFHLNSLLFDAGSIPQEEKVPEVPDHLKHSSRVIRAMEELAPDGMIKVLYAATASDRTRHIPPSVLDLLAGRNPDMAFLVPSDRTGKSPEKGNIYTMDTTGGLADYVTAIDQCDLLVSTDSSAYHIAAALGIPALVFFGPVGSAIRAHNYPKVVALDSAYSGLTCRAPCGISILQVTPPVIGIGAGCVKNLETGAKITTFDGRTFAFDPQKGCPESNATGMSFSPCLDFSENEILAGFEKVLSLIRKDE
jgi:hypothetical protein